MKIEPVRLYVQAVSPIHTVSQVWIVLSRKRSIFVLGAGSSPSLCTDPAGSERGHVGFQRRGFENAGAGLTLMVLLCLPIVREGK
jgi:hypothetical protein